VQLDDGTELSAALVVAADGRNSVCRAAAGIDVETWDYPQIAIAAQFSHSRDHRGISSEFHRPAGPCTVVPMPGRRSSLAWVERPAIAQRLGALDEAAFVAALEARLHGVLGSISQVGPRRLFPLAGLKAAALGRNRVVLVGEAGHTLPPIGAQGLNLGFRDIATLADLVAAARAAEEDIGGDKLLARYTAARGSDVAWRTTAVDLINRSLLAEILPADLARGLGLHLVAGIGALKRQVMRAGFEPAGDLPRLMRAPVGA
jgi:2-octaprenyl-6-methoxyphenol hydroxylase